MACLLGVGNDFGNRRLDQVSRCWSAINPARLDRPIHLTRYPIGRNKLLTNTVRAFIIQIS